MEWRSSVPISNVNISLEEGFLSTDLSSNPSDIHMNLNKKSPAAMNLQKHIDPLDWVSVPPNLFNR